jgi:signal transduction histidine kinase
MLDRSIARLWQILDRPLSSLAEASLLAVNVGRLSVAEFVAELQTAAEPIAALKNCTFTVSAVVPDLAIEVNKEQLLAAIGTLLQNAFKFTDPGSEVTLDAYALGDHVLIDVKDHCGGLPPGSVETMFLPMRQSAGHASGHVARLSNARRSVVASGGVLKVRDMPGEGCVFTVALPRHLMPQDLV